MIMLFSKVFQPLNDMVAQTTQEVELPYYKFMYKGILILRCTDKEKNVTTE